MKAVKIVLVLLVVSLIGFFIVRAIIVLPSPPSSSPTSSENQFAKRIEDKIESFKIEPVDRFSKDLYNEIKYLINEYHSKNRFGEKEIVNNEKKKDLEKNLFSAYKETFQKQAKVVLKKEEWQSEKLKFIQREITALQSSVFMKERSEELDVIQASINKYYEVNSFVTQTRGFNYHGKSLSDRFQLDKVREIIVQADIYLENVLNDEYVKNCTSLHEELKDISEILFKAHVRYLDRKIDKLSNSYNNYRTEASYINLFYNVLRSEIEDLDMHSVNNYRSEYNRLLKKLDSDKMGAINYFFNK